MIELLVRAAAATPTPTPTVDPELVTPGPVGFAIVAVLVVVVGLLIWDMLRRVRRVRYREEVRAELDAEEQAASAPDSDADEAGPKS
ncbi:hypothetical protein GCM10025768_15540 [Microbacterium pseudoresistens]|uniref:Flagellar biosynthesis/type III secretory pathway M-ring protein FliF/YscJ n=1 Tax=Microbacterium pseudoresistens TaxID=640634 RepID=A0A7Y9JM30_9MICO|nr:hypothetical protein [Microbacterium pseudoresistens]NYD53093.1 flagellar biosynthesis/type III secretory pathway M-ring protein FliF/YscJ [Microbacterium pseudoresistens]